MLNQYSSRQSRFAASVAGNYKFLKWALAILIGLTGFNTRVNAQAVVDATTMNNKVLAGYQGWFRTPGDGQGNKGWSHLFSANLARPGFDTWPDMSEFGPDEKTAVPGYTHPDGSQAYLYSAQNAKVVMRHFQWMKQYGLDGVWLSEFCDHFPGGRQANDSTTVFTIMHNVQAAARATGRTWAFMWDMSGFGANTPKADVYNIIINNWKRMVDEGVTTDPRYMHHNGKPVLLIWGFFPSRPASQPEYMTPVVDFLLAPGKYQATLVAGADDKWRQGTPEFQAMLMRMQALQPWSVGRRVPDAVTGYPTNNIASWAGDLEMCKKNNVIFQPVFNSGTHKAGPPPVPPAVPAVPRRMGNYLWEQFVQASKTGVINSAFVAMFDEINEGTQLYKVTNKPPVQFPFLTYDGATSDYYLRLAGAGAKLLKTGKPISPVIPISPFSPTKWYKLKNAASSLTLTNKSKTAKGGIVQATDIAGMSGEWQLLFDGNGYFKIKSRFSGKVLSASTDGAINQVVDSKADSQKWHLEWDTTGQCRIVSKTTGKALSSSNSTTDGSPIIQAADVKDSDELRWRVIEL